MSDGRVSCIARPARTRYVRLWPGYVELCAGNVCAALLLDNFEHWTNVRLRNAEQDGVEGEPDLWVYRSRPELIADLCGAFGKDAVDNGVRQLLELGLIERRNNPDRGWDRKFQYRLNVEAAQAAFRLDTHSRESADASPGEPNMGDQVRNGTEPPESGAETQERESADGLHTHSRKPDDASSETRPSIIGNPTSNTEEPKKKDTHKESAPARTSVLDLVDAELRAIAAAKTVTPVSRDRLRRILRSFPDPDHVLEAERCRHWAIEGNGKGARLEKGIAPLFERWLRQSPKRAAPGAEPPAPFGGRRRSKRSAEGNRAARAAAAQAAQDRRGNFDQAERERAIELWGRALEKASEAGVPASAHESFLIPMEPVGFRDGTLHMDAPERCAEWFDRRFGNLLKAAVRCDIKVLAIPDAVEAAA